jgi:hypothetical protein
MSNISPTDEWFTGEYGQTIEPLHAHAVVPKAIEDINARYKSELNDDLPADL